MATTSASSASSAGTTAGGLGGTTQDLSTGLNYDADGNVVVRDIKVPDGEHVVQVDQLGAFRRVVFSNGAVQTDQTEAANQGNAGEIVTPVPLPGEQQDVTGTGQDAATKPKVAPGAKTGAAAEKAVKSDSK